MTDTIIMADGVERTFDKVAVEDGFAHCYDKMDTSFDNWTGKLAFEIWLAFQPTDVLYEKVTSIPANRIKEIK